MYLFFLSCTFSLIHNMYQETSQMFSFPFARQKGKYKIALSPSFRADWGKKKKFRRE